MSDHELIRKLSINHFKHPDVKVKPTLTSRIIRRLIDVSPENIERYINRKQHSKIINAK